MRNSGSPTWKSWFLPSFGRQGSYTLILFFLKGLNIIWFRKVPVFPVIKKFEIMIVWLDIFCLVFWVIVMISVSRTPIIVIPAANTSLITMYNARDLLQDHRQEHYNSRMCCGDLYYLTHWDVVQICFAGREESQRSGEREWTPCPQTKGRRNNRPLQSGGQSLETH